MLAFIAAGMFSFNTTKAAESILYFDNEKIDYRNNILEVSVMIDSDKYINASSSYIKFNSSNLSFESASTNDSVFDIWMKHPAYSKQKNAIYFAGGKTEAFKGYGELFKIKFKIKDISKIYNDKIYFNTSLILAYDGKGTNVLTSTESITFKKQQFYMSIVK